MNRRQLMVLGGAASLAAGSAGWARTNPASSDPLIAAGEAAYLFALPLMEMAQTRARALERTPANTFRHARRLLTPDSQQVTTPNNDTLYSSAWVDLAAGPVELTLPAVGQRYMSVAVMDMYSDNIAVLGSRTTGADGGRFLIVGPGEPVDGASVIRSRSRWVWVLGRTLVEGESDLPAAHRVQDGLTLRAPGAAGTPVPAVPPSATLEQLWPGVRTLLVESPPRPEDERMLRRFSRLGLIGPAPMPLAPGETARVAEGVRRARTFVRDGGWSGLEVNGWVYPKHTLGDFGQDYAYRAQIARSGLAALPVSEAIYLRPVAPAGGRDFNDDRLYALTFPAGAAPPVDAFWSISMYRVTEDGQLFFTPNSLDRWAIGDRSPGLARAADGSLTIWIGRTDPGPGRRNNWLPAPPSGPYVFTFRAYLPQEPFHTGVYRLPPVRAVA